jgi:hypothetical protein
MSIRRGEEEEEEDEEGTANNEQDMRERGSEIRIWVLKSEKRKRSGFSSSKPKSGFRNPSLPFGTQDTKTSSRQPQKTKIYRSRRGDALLVEGRRLCRISALIEAAL